MTDSYAANCLNCTHTETFTSAAKDPVPPHQRKTDHAMSLRWVRGGERDE